MGAVTGASVTHRAAELELGICSEWAVNRAADLRVLEGL